MDRGNGVRREEVDGLRKRMRLADPRQEIGDPPEGIVGLCHERRTLELFRNKKLFDKRRLLQNNSVISKNNDISKYPILSK
jgi:hypothetical protein